MTPTEAAKRLLIANYVQPARRRGEKSIRIRVGNVLKELGWTNRTPSVFSTLSSQAFQRDAGLELIEKIGGPPSGGPSTTWTFVYRILDGEPNSAGKRETIVPNGAGLMDLAGICAEVFSQFGGGETFLKSERDWEPDVWERYAAEQAKKELTGEDI